MIKTDKLTIKAQVGPPLELRCAQHDLIRAFALEKSEAPSVACDDLGTTQCWVLIVAESSFLPAGSSWYDLSWVTSDLHFNFFISSDARCRNTGDRRGPCLVHDGCWRWTKAEQAWLPPGRSQTDRYGRCPYACVLIDMSGYSVVTTFLGVTIINT